MVQPLAASASVYAACWARARATFTGVRLMWVTMPSASLLLGARTKTVPFTAILPCLTRYRTHGNQPPGIRRRYRVSSCHPPPLAALAQTVPLRGDDKQPAAECEHGPCDDRSGVTSMIPGSHRG
jgi:hypothetical protein